MCSPTNSNLCCQPTVLILSGLIHVILQCHRSTWNVLECSVCEKKSGTTSFCILLVFSESTLLSPVVLHRQNPLNHRYHTYTFRETTSQSDSLLSDSGGCLMFDFCAQFGPGSIISAVHTCRPEFSFQIRGNCRPWQGSYNLVSRHPVVFWWVERSRHLRARFCLRKDEVPCGTWYTIVSCSHCLWLWHSVLSVDRWVPAEWAARALTRRMWEISRLLLRIVVKGEHGRALP